MSKNRRLGLINLLIASSVACSTMACASWFMKGSTQHKGPLPHNALAEFRVPSCTMANGEEIDGPDTTYYLIRGRSGPELIEAERSGRASAITNYWRDEAGHNFATYVKGRQAWHYVIPDNPDEPAERRVFMQYGISKHAQGFRLTGAPIARCAMARSGGSVPTSAAAAAPAPAAEPAVAPAPAAASVASPAPTPVPVPVVDAGVGDAAATSVMCVPGSTQECVGPGGCRGGQACLGDGSGFGACDCGEGAR